MSSARAGVEYGPAERAESPRPRRSGAMTRQPSLARRRVRCRTGVMPYEYAAEGSSTGDGLVPRNRATSGGCNCGRPLMRSSTEGSRPGNPRSALVNSLWTTSRRYMSLPAMAPGLRHASGHCMRQMRMRSRSRRMSYGPGSDYIPPPHAATPEQSMDEPVEAAVAACPPSAAGAKDTEALAQARRAR